MNEVPKRDAPAEEPPSRGARALTIGVSFVLCMTYIDVLTSIPGCSSDTETNAPATGGTANSDGSQSGGTSGGPAGGASGAPAGGAAGAPTGGAAGSPTGGVSGSQTGGAPAGGAGGAEFGG